MQRHTTTEALRAFLDKHTEKRPELVAFVKAGDSRVPDWLKGGGPSGFNLVRLRTYLTEQGFKLSEWQHLDSRLFTLSRIISRNIVTSKDAADFIGTVEQSLLSTLLGKRNFSGEKIAKVQELNSLYGETLTPLATGTSEALGHPSPKIVIGERITLDQNAAFSLLASAITLIVPIAEYLASDQCSAEQRNVFRKQVGSKTLFDATNGLNALTSETSREMMKRR